MIEIIFQKITRSANCRGDFMLRSIISLASTRGAKYRESGSFISRRTSARNSQATTQALVNSSWLPGGAEGGGGEIKLSRFKRKQEGAFGGQLLTPFRQSPRREDQRILTPRKEERKS